MVNIYHISSWKAWEEAVKRNGYQSDSLARKGFIHCSLYTQLLRVANTFYRGQKDLVILVIDPTRLTSEMRWEPGTDKQDELFPHVYGPINLDAVSRVLDFKENPEGQFNLPSV